MSYNRVVHYYYGYFMTTYYIFNCVTNFENDYIKYMVMFNYLMTKHIYLVSDKYMQENICHKSHENN